MSTVNMKKVGDAYEVDMDPFAEYKHTKPQDVSESETYVEATTQPKRIDEARKKMNKVVENVDEMIEGAELIFEFGNKLAERFGRF